MKKMIAALALLGLSSPVFAQEAPVAAETSAEVAGAEAAGAAATGTLTTVATVGLGIAAAGVLYSVASTLR